MNSEKKAEFDCLTADSGQPTSHTINDVSGLSRSSVQEDLKHPRVLPSNSESTSPPSVRTENVRQMQLASPLGIMSPTDYKVFRKCMNLTRYVNLANTVKDMVDEFVKHIDDVESTAIPTEYTHKNLKHPISYVISSRARLYDT